MRSKVLAVIFLLGVAITAYFITKFISTTNFTSFSDYPLALGFAIGAVCIHLIAHCFRSFKFQRLLKPVKDADQLLIFKTLSIGFLFNAILPFRIGEFVRAHLIGTSLYISRTLVFFTILFERAIDGVILTLLVFPVLFWGGLSIPYSNVIYTLLLSILAISVLVIVFTILLATQNKGIIRVIDILSSLLNNGLRNKVRHISWLVIHGSHSIFKAKNIALFVILSFFTWILYLSSVVVLFMGLGLSVPLIDQILVSISSFLSVSVPSGPAYIGSFQYYFSQILDGIPEIANLIFPFSIYSWILLVLPISLIGLIFFLFASKSKEKAFGIMEPQLVEHGGALNKLYRYNNISNEFIGFLDNYFSGTEISKALNDLEFSGEIKIIKKFKGGSNAITALIWDGVQQCVRKITLPQYASKLESQYNWLQERQESSNIPKVLQMVTDDKRTYLDIAFEEEHVPFFDYIHSQPIEKSEHILSLVVQFVNKKVHTRHKKNLSRENLEFYISTKVEKKVQDCLALIHELQKVITYPELVINGKTYDNLSVILEKITNHEKIMEDLSHYTSSVLHGDLTIDNLLINNDHFILIDPNDENFIDDPIVDYAKLYQSLHSGYEFLCELKTIKVEGNSIAFEENISSKYTALFAFLQKELKEILSETEMRNILFHEAIHYTRMLTYKAQINPNTFLAFYGIAVRLFNEFYNSSREALET